MDVARRGYPLAVMIIVLVVIAGAVMRASTPLKRIREKQSNTG
jgi:hypothetical protein